MSDICELTAFEWLEQVKILYISLQEIPVNREKGATVFLTAANANKKTDYQLTLGSRSWTEVIVKGPWQSLQPSSFHLFTCSLLSTVESQNSNRELHWLRIR
jgi:hypothetical protein